ncbi:MAG: nuclear transport factor 2 family protein [Gammaproteobacteria bacterium]|nr:nuclear transport factor 2 family protein [Gammaproteobacteria bacterium]MDH5653821.1 nuclear transport factor 2 family protein [Gammaproteobacteria bacterium]
MPKSTPRYKSADEAEVVYYEAFRHCDVDVMASVWAEQGALCVHPGSGPIVGNAAVRRSWQHIFSNVLSPDLSYTVLSRAVSDELAVHVVREELRVDANSVVLVLATNVYRKFSGGWQMIEHHASLLPVRSEGQTLQ